IRQRGRGLFNLSTMPNGLIGGPAGHRATGKIARNLVGRAERHIDIVADDGRSGVPARAAVVRFALQTGILVAALLTAGLLGGAPQRRLVTAAAIGRRTLRHLQLRANGLPALVAAVALVEFLHHEPREIEAADLLFGRRGGVGRTELDGARFDRLLERRLAVIAGGESRERRRERKRDSG